MEFKDENSFITITLGSRGSICIKYLGEVGDFDCSKTILNSTSNLVTQGNSVGDVKKSFGDFLNLIFNKKIDNFEDCFVSVNFEKKIFYKIFFCNIYNDPNLKVIDTTGI
jgi:hypothetical protein